MRLRLTVLYRRGSGPSVLPLCMLIGFFVSDGAATTRTVPTQYPRIQNAIWASNPGDNLSVSVNVPTETEADRVLRQPLRPLQ